MTRNGVVDFRTIGCGKFDLNERREQIEILLAPYVTMKATGRIVAFKGKRRYLADGLPPNLLFTVFALQALYQIEAATRAGDADRIVRATLTFAHYDQETQNLATFKSHSVDALAFAARHRITKPAAMRQRKAEVVAKGDSGNHDHAQLAIEWARQQYPTKATDGSIDFLKGKAAERLGITKRTLNRWLAQK